MNKEKELGVEFGIWLDEKKPKYASEIFSWFSSKRREETEELREQMKREWDKCIDNNEPFDLGSVLKILE